MTFQYFPHTNAQGRILWLCRKKKVKCQPRVIIWRNLLDLESPMLYTKSQSQSFLGSGEEGFQVFLPYMGMAAILINWPWPFVQIFNSPLTEGTTWTLKKIGPEVSEK